MNMSKIIAILVMIFVISTGLNACSGGGSISGEGSGQGSASGSGQVSGSGSGQGK